METKHRCFILRHFSEVRVTSLAKSSVFKSFDCLVIGFLGEVVDNYSGARAIRFSELCLFRLHPGPRGRLLALYAIEYDQMLSSGTICTMGIECTVLQAGQPLLKHSLRLHSCAEDGHRPFQRKRRGQDFNL